MTMKTTYVGMGLLACALFATGCGPSPEDVCQKTFTLLKAEVGEPGANKVIGGDMKACVDRETMRKDMQGMIKYRTNNACLMDAKTATDVTACGKK
jgi:hypothetical protein